MWITQRKAIAHGLTGIGLILLALVSNPTPSQASTGVTPTKANARSGAWSFPVLEDGAAGWASSEMASLAGLSGAAAGYGQALVTLTTRDVDGAPVGGVEVTFSVDGDASIAAADPGGDKTLTTNTDGQAVISVAKATTGDAVVSAAWMAGAIAQQLQTTLTFVAAGTGSAKTINGWTTSAPGAIVRGLHTYAAANAPAGLPEGTSLPHGLASFAISVTSAGDWATVTVTLPGTITPIAKLWKYLPTCVAGAPTTWSWVDVTMQATGIGTGDNEYSISLQDGGFGDADCQANGVIIDPQGPGENPSDIPTLAEWALIALMLLMAAYAVWRLRRSPALVQLALALPFFLFGGALIAGLGSCPLGIAGHEPGDEVDGRTMRSPLQPDAGSSAATIVAQLEAEVGATLTGVAVHYRKAGGAWASTDASAAVTGPCAGCWSATLPLGGVVAGDTVEYHLEATFQSDPSAYLYDGAKDPCPTMDCGSHGACEDWACACDAGWDGAACDQCAGGYYGSSCSACPSCGSHGACNDGLGGNGQCACATGWAGASCNTCASNYYGSSCAACPSCGSHGTCNDGLGGDGQCACATGWAGARCTTCASNYYGATCAACPSCGSHGSCNDGLGGNGACVCSSGYHGATCQYSCSDGAKNGAELDTDCGGPCAASCGPAPLVDNGDGTVTDPSTGLIWQNTQMTGKKQTDANAYCQANSIGLPGSGWRLPNISELRSLIRDCPQTVTDGTCDVADPGCLSPYDVCYTYQTCHCSDEDSCYWDTAALGSSCSSYYWSTSMISSEPGFAWYVRFNSGGVFYNFISQNARVRCVRGP
jgi:hypothetical protein